MIALSIPDITQQYLSVVLVDTSLMVPAGQGGDALQQAIKCMNEKDTEGAISAFGKNLTQGLGPLREGYAYAQIGVLKIKQADLACAIQNFIKVQTYEKSLYDTVHIAAQYLNIILIELNRHDEAAILQKIIAKTNAYLGYSLWSAEVMYFRSLVQRMNK